MTSGEFMYLGIVVGSMALFAIFLAYAAIRAPGK